jgi:hypothetical protein
MFCVVLIPPVGVDFVYLSAFLFTLVYTQSGLVSRMCFCASVHKSHKVKKGNIAQG